MRLSREIREALRHPKPNKVIWIKTGPQPIERLPYQTKFDLVRRYGKVLT